MGRPVRPLTEADRDLLHPQQQQEQRPTRARGQVRAATRDELRQLGFVEPNTTPALAYVGVGNDAMNPDPHRWERYGEAAANQPGMGEEIQASMDQANRDVGEYVTEDFGRRFSNVARDMHQYGAQEAAARAGEAIGGGNDLSQTERQRRADHEAQWAGNEFWNTDELNVGGVRLTGPAASTAAGVADITGGIFGSLDPTVMLGAGKTWITRILSNAGINLGIDSTLQGVDMATGVQDEFSPERAAISAGAGAALPAAGEVISHLTRPIDPIVNSVLREMYRSPDGRALMESQGIVPDRRGNFSAAHAERFDADPDLQQRAAPLFQTAAERVRAIRETSNTQRNQQQPQQPQQTQAQPNARQSTDAGPVDTERSLAYPEITAYLSSRDQRATAANIDAAVREITGVENGSIEAANAAAGRLNRRAEERIVPQQDNTTLRRRKGENERQFEARRIAAQQAEQRRGIEEARQRAQEAGEPWPPRQEQTSSTPVRVEPDVYTYNGQSYVDAPEASTPRGMRRLQRYDRDAKGTRLLDEYVTIPEDHATFQRAGGSYRPDASAEHGREQTQAAEVAARQDTDRTFRTADRQRDRAGAEVRDTQVGGRPEGVNPQGVTVHVDGNERYPVRVLGDVLDENGQPIRGLREVERYDPRTDKAEGQSYAVSERDLRTVRYAAEPRRAQDFADRAEGPPSPERPRLADEPISREPNQTYRMTPDDPEDRAFSPRGEDPNAPRPTDGGGPNQYDRFNDFGVDDLGPGFRAIQDAIRQLEDEGFPPVRENQPGREEYVARLAEREQKLRAQYEAEDVTARASRGADDRASPSENVDAQAEKNKRLREEYEARRRSAQPNQTNAREGEGPFRDPRTADDYVRSYRERQRRQQNSEAGEERARQRYEGSKPRDSSDAPYRRVRRENDPEGGVWHTDEDAYVTSGVARDTAVPQPGGPIRFRSQKAAATWIVRNTANTDGVHYEIVNHPSAKNQYSVRAYDANTHEPSPSPRDNYERPTQALPRSQAPTGPDADLQRAAEQTAAEGAPATRRRISIAPEDPNAQRAGPLPPREEATPNPTHEAMAENAAAMREVAQAIGEMARSIKESLQSPKAEPEAPQVRQVPPNNVISGEVRDGMLPNERAEMLRREATEGFDPEIQARLDAAREKLRERGGDPEQVDRELAVRDPDAEHNAFIRAYEEAANDIADNADNIHAGGGTHQARLLLQDLRRLTTLEQKSQALRRRGAFTDEMDVELTNARREMHRRLQDFGMERPGRPDSETNMLVGLRPLSEVGRLTNVGRRFVGEARVTSRADGSGKGRPTVTVSREVKPGQLGEAVFIMPDGRMYAGVQRGVPTDTTIRGIAEGLGYITDGDIGAQLRNDMNAVRVNNQTPLADGSYPLFEVAGNRRLTYGQVYSLLRLADEVIAANPKREYSIVVGEHQMRVDRNDLSGLVDEVVALNLQNPKTRVRSSLEDPSLRTNVPRDSGGGTVYSLGPDALREMWRRMGLGRGSAEARVAPEERARTERATNNVINKVESMLEPSQRTVLDEISRPFRGPPNPGQTVRGVVAVADAFAASKIVPLQRMARENPHLRVEANTPLAEAMGPEYVGRNPLWVLADWLGSDPASARNTARAIPYERQIAQEVGRYGNKLERALRGLDDAAMTRVYRHVVGDLPRIAPEEARVAREVRALLAERLAYMREAGVKVGDRGPEYITRSVDAEAVMRDQKGFLAAAERAYRIDGLHSGAEAEAAQAWAHRVLFPSSSRTGAIARLGNGDPNPVRNRKLSAEAARELIPFYDTNLRRVLSEYGYATAQHAEYVRRFGQNGERLQAIMRHLEDKVPPDTFRRIAPLVDDIVGMSPTREIQEWRQTVGVAKTAATMVIMARAVLAQIAEPLSVAARTGRLRDGINTFVASADQMALSGIRGDREALAQSIGVIGDMAAHMMSEARVLRADTPGQQALMHAYFERNLMRGATDAQRIAATWVGQGILRDFLRVSTGARPGAKVHAQRLLNDYGISEAMAPRVLRYADELNALPVKDRAARLDVDTSAEARLYRQALYSHVTRTILEPTLADSARLANVPYIRNAYQIASFPFTFTREILLGSVARNLFGEDGAFRGRNLSVADRAMMLNHLSGYLLMAGGTLAINKLIREPIFDSGRQKEQELGQDVLEQMSRANAFGTLDGFVNLTATNARYNRDYSSSLAGAGVGSALTDMSSLIKGLPGMPGNSPDTNNAEWAATRALYRLIVAPVVNVGLTLAPVPKPLSAAAMAYTSSSDAARGVADAIVGERTVVPGRRRPPAVSEDNEYGGGATDDYGEPTYQRTQDTGPLGTDDDERFLNAMGMFGDLNVREDARRSDNVVDLRPQPDEQPNDRRNPYGGNSNVAVYDPAIGVRTVNVGGRYYNVPERMPDGRRPSDDRVREMILRGEYPVLGVYPRLSTAERVADEYPETQRAMLERAGIEPNGPEHRRMRGRMWGERRRVNIDERLRQ